MLDIFENNDKEEIKKFSGKSGAKNKKSKKSKDPEKSKIIRKLKHKTKYLEIELEEAEALQTKAKKAFFAHIQRYCKNHPGAKNPLILTSTNSEKDKNQKNKEEFPEELKAIYREICLATHPDTHQDNQEEMINIFQNASAAKQKNKIEDLINISFDLDIDISNISFELIEDLEKALIEKEKRIQKIRQDESIHYYYLDQKGRFNMIKQICPISPKEKKDEKD